MSEAIADLLSAELAREIAQTGLRAFAVTSPASVAAALAARELGAPGLALIVGFTALDGAPVPAVTLGEAGLLARGSVFRDDPGDVFAALARGRVGVAAAPAQLDACGRTNLSGIGPPGSPRVALPGARGLPDHRTPSPVWYLFAQHGPRSLVERVDVVCGAVPPAGAIRRLLTAAGSFELTVAGWRCRWLTPGGARAGGRRPRPRRDPVRRRAGARDARPGGDGRARARRPAWRAPDRVRERRRGAATVGGGRGARGRMIFRRPGRAPRRRPPTPPRW